MKNEILDDFQEEKIYQLLDKNEKVIWDGHPIDDFNWTFFQSDKTSETRIIQALISAIFLFIIIASIYIFSWQSIAFLMMTVFVVTFSRIFSFYKKRKTRYLITEKRIVFQLLETWRKKYYAIPFSKIKNLVISNEFDNIGVIYLVVQKPENIPFDTYNLNNGERRHQPTLEMIQDVEEVAQYIKLGIKGKL